MQSGCGAARGVSDAHGGLGASVSASVERAVGAEGDVIAVTVVVRGGRLSARAAARGGAVGQAMQTLRDRHSHGKRWSSRPAYRIGSAQRKGGRGYK